MKANDRKSTTNISIINNTPENNNTTSNMISCS